VARAPAIPAVHEMVSPGFALTIGRHSQISRIVVRTSSEYGLTWTDAPTNASDICEKPVVAALSNHGNTREAKNQKQGTETQPAARGRSRSARSPSPKVQDSEALGPEKAQRRRLVKVESAHKAAHTTTYEVERENRYHLSATANRNLTHLFSLSSG
jgi:hypothetical protein